MSAVSPEDLPPPDVNDPHVVENPVDPVPWAVRMGLSSFQAFRSFPEAERAVLAEHVYRLQSPFRMALRYGPSRML